MNTSRNHPTGRLWKLTREEECHYGFQYKDGLNVDTIPFAPYGECMPGGLYFFRERDLVNMTDAIAFIPKWVREVTLPDDALVYQTSGKCKADKFILGERKPFVELFRECESIQTTKFLLWACAEGYTDVAEFLLTCDHVDPTKYSNAALQMSSGRGYVDIVRLLLADKRVDPAGHDSMCIRCAAINGHDEVLELLLQDGRADPSTSNNYSIRRASERGYDKVVRLLLKDGRADPTVYGNYAIQMASMTSMTRW